MEQVSVIWQRSATGQGAVTRLARPLAAFSRAACAIACLVLPLWHATASRASGDANRTACATSSESSPGFRPYMPDCRAYELVSPPYREGGVPIAEPGAVSTAGEAMVASFGGVTAGAENAPLDFTLNSDVVLYKLQRSASGWETVVLTPPATRYERSAPLAIGGVAGVSRVLWSAQQGSIEHKESLYLQDGGEELREVGPEEIPALVPIALKSSEELFPVGASADLSRSVYTITNEYSSVGRHDTWPGDSTRREAQSLYEYRYGGAASGEPTLVGVKNQGPLVGSPHINEGAELISECGTTLGSTPVGSSYNAISEDGESVFFTARACGGSPPVNELYARVGGARTVAISEPSTQDCQACDTSSEALRPATFEGASADGRRAFFLTDQALLPGQEGMGLYLYDFSAAPASAERPDGRTARVSPGAKPEVQGVVRVSEDGSRVYFVARGALAGANAEGRAPQAGADNLYVYEPDPAHAGSSHVVFVATLLTPAMESEATAREEAIEAQALATAVEYWEARCPPAFGNFSCIAEVEAVLQREESALGYFDVLETIREDRALWSTEDVRPAQATPDGRFLVFASSALLTPDDASSVPQLFEYDAQGGAGGEGSLTRVSIGQDGSYAGDGNVTRFREAPQIPRPPYAFSDLPNARHLGLAVSEDGSRVFFTSAAPLTPLAVSGQPSVFEYREGNVYLVSDGRDAASASGLSAVQLYGTDPSGADVFFTTADQLVPQAADTQQALYDAREEGGFPAPTLAPGCIGETCRGATGEAPAPTAIGTAAQPVEQPEAAAPAGLALARVPHPGARGKLARALRACHRLRAKRRRACVARARRRYGSAARAQAATARARMTSTRRPSGVAR
jgi:hypothetical protein